MFEQDVRANSKQIFSLSNVNRNRYPQSTMQFLTSSTNDNVMQIISKITNSLKYARRSAQLYQRRLKNKKTSTYFQRARIAFHRRYNYIMN